MSDTPPSPPVEIPYMVACYCARLLKCDVVMRERTARRVASRQGLGYYSVEALHDMAKDYLEQLQAAISSPERALRLEAEAGSSGLRLELHKIQRLLLSAQTTQSVEDYGDALGGAQKRLEALINSLEGKDSAP